MDAKPRRATACRATNPGGPGRAVDVEVTGTARVPSKPTTRGATGWENEDAAVGEPNGHVLGAKRELRLIAAVGAIAQYQVVTEDRQWTGSTSTHWLPIGTSAGTRWPSRRLRWFERVREQLVVDGIRRQLETRRDAELVED